MLGVVAKSSEGFSRLSKVSRTISNVCQFAFANAKEDPKTSLLFDKVKLKMVEILSQVGLKQ